MPPPTVQARLFALLIWDLVQAWRRRPASAFRYLPASGRLILGAYACGFVCATLRPAGFVIQAVAILACPVLRLARQPQMTSR